jgi:hypothetical protein
MTNNSFRISKNNVKNDEGFCCPQATLSKGVTFNNRNDRTLSAVSCFTVCRVLSTVHRPPSTFESGGETYRSFQTSLANRLLAFSSASKQARRLETLT